MRRRVSVLLVVGVLATLTTLVTAGPAGAITRTVTNQQQLRTAIADANAAPAGPHIISLGADIALTGGELRYTGSADLVLEGNGHTLSKTGDGRILNLLLTTGSLTVRDLTLTGGRAVGAEGNGGAIATDGDILLERVTIRGNTAELDGGGVYNLGGKGEMVVLNSTIRENRARNDGGGILQANGTLIVSGSTITGNRARVWGGGIYTDVINMSNSTVYGNEAAWQPDQPDAGVVTENRGGGVMLLRGGQISFSTIVENESWFGSNLYGGGSDTDLSVTATILARPRNGSVPGPGANCHGMSVGTDPAFSGTVLARFAYAHGANTSSPDVGGDCGFDGPTNSEPAADPKLGPLRDNGGPTLTMEPAADSPLLDKVSGVDCGTTDQIGRVRPQGPRPDIGAVERDAPNDATPCQGSASYVPLTPARLLDTRNGTGGTQGPLGPRQTIELDVTGVGGVPASGVGAVVLNVTSAESTTQSFVTVWPKGVARPNASNLNTEPGQNTPNLVIVKVGDGGRVLLYNDAGQGHLIADVLGWFREGVGYTGITPARLLDTRNGTGGTSGPIGPRASFDLDVTGRGGVPADGVSGVVLNVTSSDSTTQSFVTVWPSGEPRPNASNVNTDPGQNTPNLVISKVGGNGNVSMYNNAGTGELIADVLGFFPDGGDYHPLTPARVLDTRTGLGGTQGPLGPRQTIELQVGGLAGVPRDAAGAVVLNVTSTESTAASFITVWPTGVARPNASNLNTDPASPSQPAGQDTPNLVIVKLGTGGRVSLYNDAGTGHLVADVVGWFLKS